MSAGWVLVGNPGCRRIGFWQTALVNCALQRARLVTYADLLSGKVSLTEALSPETVLRWESALENGETYKLFLRHGLEPSLREGYPVMVPDEIDRLGLERGWMIKTRQAHLGFVRLLQSVSASVEQSGTRWLHHPQDILLQFDKTACQTLLNRNGIPIPRFLGHVSSYQQLREHCSAQGRLMLKLANGSGGQGCMALHWSRGRIRAVSTVRETVVGGEARLYCSKRPQLHHDEADIARIVDRLCQERVHVEEWLPKAQWQGRNFDLRIVTIAGQPRHAVARMSGSPFTNLNLGNQRGDLPAIQTKLGSHWEEVQRTVERTAALFPQSFTLGIDVLVRPDYRRHAVLEVNAFGNLLPRLLDRGEDTYTAAVATWQRCAAGHPVMS